MLLGQSNKANVRYGNISASNYYYYYVGLRCIILWNVIVIANT